MDRRVFLKSTALGLAALGLGATAAAEKTHIITLSFDDGFKRSFYKIADLYEAHGLSACFNVIASGHFPDFQRVDDWISPELLGNFDDWNTLKSRGHEVMPHSWKHLNLARQPLEEAKEWVVKCLDYFSANLDGYTNEEAVFNFPFNSSAPALEEFTLSKVLAIRSRELDRTAAEESNLFRKGCRTFGPKNIDHWVKREVNKFLKSDGGWLILNVHGLDNEGWGPMSTSFLERLLKRLVKIQTLEVLPTGYVLNRIKHK
ncbi:MAG: polysaccharide deacetylase family protein [Saprospiraceae bacterium]|nr:polysaccharide deacetylase family protein [Saprospiraceae bacterium]